MEGYLLKLRPITVYHYFIIVSITTIFGCGETVTPDITAVSSEESFMSSSSESESSSNESSSESSTESSSSSINASNLSSIHESSQSVSSEESSSSELVSSSEFSSSSAPLTPEQLQAIQDSLYREGRPEEFNANEYIFNDDAPVKTYNVLIDSDALARLDANPKAEVYEFGHIVFEGDTVENIQVRYKGTSGSWAGMADGVRIDCTSGGKKSCVKLALKIKFNTSEDPDRKFYGLKKLLFHHMNWYPNQMNERLGYWMHRTMGTPAPRAIHARVLINDSLNGLYTLVEQIDGRFARDNFEDGTGNVYKEFMPLSSGNPTTDNGFMSYLKTNEDENPVFTVTQTFEQELQNTQNSEAIKAVIRKWMDVPTLVNTVLTGFSMIDWDGAYFLGYGKNTYWYEDPTEQQLHLIPWDLNNSFWQYNSWSRFSTTAATIQSDYETRIKKGLECSLTSSYTLSKHWLCFPEEASAGIDKLLTDVYPNIDAMLDKWEAQITDTHNEVHEKWPGAFPTKGSVSYDEWHIGLDSLRTFYVPETHKAIERLKVFVEGLQ